MSHVKRCLNVFLCFSPLLMAADPDPPLTARERKMLERIDTLEQRLAAVESRLTATAAPESAKPAQAQSAAVTTAGPSTVATAAPAATTPHQSGGFLADTAVDMTLYAYYGYNFK